MYQVTLTLRNDPRHETFTLDTLDLALAKFDHAKAFYSEVKRRIGIKGDYSLTLSTGLLIVKSEAI